MRSLRRRSPLSRWAESRSQAIESRSVVRCEPERVREYRNNAVGGSAPPNGASSLTYTQVRAVSVLPFASTGIGVSSPCSRWAPSTCAAIRSCSGRSANAHAPT